MLATRVVRLFHQQLISNDHSREACGRATFAVRHHTAAGVVVTVQGDIDATNGRALARFVQRHTVMSGQLVLDLTGVDFFGSQGFTALHYIEAHCARRDVDWTLVASPAVRRLVKIVDTHAELPVVDAMTAALTRLDHMSRDRLRLDHV